jgi:hypothetical protein
MVVCPPGGTTMVHVIRKGKQSAPLPAVCGLHDRAAGFMSGDGSQQQGVDFALLLWWRSINGVFFEGTTNGE